MHLRPEDLNGTGHICTYDTQHLKWPYLSSLVQKGKKFRLPCSAEKLFEELQEALTSYIAWAMKGKVDPHRERNLEDWADAVLTQARANWEAAELQRDARQMDGYPGFRSAIQETKQHVVFLCDDRAPHGIFVICKRWCQQQMARSSQTPRCLKMCHHHRPRCVTV